MWTAPVLLWILGSVWLWGSVQGAAIGGLEDEIVTPGTDNGMVTPGLEDKLATTAATEESSVSTHKAAQALTSTESRTKSPIEELPTPGGSIQGHEENKSTTTVKVVTSHSVDKKTSHPNRDNTLEETQTTGKKGGLAVVTLVGIIVGVLLAIGFIGGIIIVIMRKISGRFS
ncbi:podoplanin isoform X2 [Nannospalax galili]|nr:podoplanin isoform X2 [Nannospalax galili]